MPPNPRHGIVRTLTGSTTYQNIVLYECDANYILQGNNTRVCTEFGWDSIEPTCKCKYFFFKFHIHIKINCDLINEYD